MIKVKISSVSEHNYQKLYTAIGRGAEEFNNRSYFQHAGFTSLPKANTVGIVIEDGNTFTMVATADPSSSRPTLASAGDAAIYSDADTYVMVKDDGEIEIANENNSITLKANGDIEIGNANLDKLVKQAVLTTLAAHTHPVSGAVAGVSTDAGMIALPTAPGNFTQNTEAD